MNTSVTRYHGQLSSCTISEKTNTPILRKLSDGQTDGWVDGRVGWWTDRRADKKTNRQTRVISEDAVQLTSSIQNRYFFHRYFSRILLNLTKVITL